MVASPGQPCGVGAPCFFFALAMAVLKLFSRRFDSLINALCSLTAANTGSIAVVVIVISGSSYGPTVIADARAAFERLAKRSIEAAREQRPAPILFVPESPHRPQPQLAPQARPRGSGVRKKPSTHQRRSRRPAAGLWTTPAATARDQ